MNTIISKPPEMQQRQAIAIGRDARGPGKIGRGLIIFEFRESNLALFARMAVETCLASGSSDLGIPLRGPRIVHSLHSGPRRSFQTLKSLLGTASTPGIKLEHLSSSSRLDWCSPEGLAVLQERLAKTNDAWVTILLIADENGEQLRLGLQSMRSMANASGSDIVVFLGSSEAERRLDLSSISDEYIDVHSCEAPPHVLASFGMKWRGLEPMAPLCSVSRMCSISAPDGQYLAQFSPFVHESLEYQQTWVLARLGFNTTEIAEILDIHKSTAHRRLAEMPPPKRCTPHEEKQLAKEAVHLGVDKDRLKTTRKRLRERQSRTSRPSYSEGS